MSTSLREYGHIFIGDCGVGKSTLANTVAEGDFTRTSSSLDEVSSIPPPTDDRVTSQTRHVVKWEWRNASDQQTRHYVIDTRGFSSDNVGDRDQALAQLDHLFSQAINLNIIFVVQFDNGRPRFHDARVIDVVMTALEQRGGSVVNSATTPTLSRHDKINLIVNKVSDDVVQQAKAFGGQMFDRTICNERMKVLLGKRYTTSPHVLYIPHVSSLDSRKRKTKTEVGTTGGSTVTANWNGAAMTSMTTNSSTTSLNSMASTTSSSSTTLSVLPNRSDLVTFMNKANLTKHRTERAYRLNFTAATEATTRLNFEQRLQTFEMKYYQKLRPPMSFVLSAAQPCARLEATRALSELDGQLREVFGQQQREVDALRDGVRTEGEENRTRMDEMETRERALKQRVEALELENGRLKETQRKVIALLKPLVDADRLRALLGPEEVEADEEVDGESNSTEEGSQTAGGVANGGGGSPPNGGLPRAAKTGGSSLRAPNSRIPKMKKRVGKAKG